jgi:vancomycin resistance protein VanJ
LPAAWLAWIVGQAARDRTWLTGLCFYIPSPALSAALAVVSFVAWRRKRRTIAVMALVLALPPIVCTAALENRWVSAGDETPPPGSLRLLHWNVFWGHLGWDRVESEVVRRSPDLCVLSEAPKDLLAETLAGRLGESYRSLEIAPMWIVARGALRSEGWLADTREMKVHSILWDSPAGTIRLFAVDLCSSPFVARDPWLRRLTALAAERRPDIIVGDMNSPRRSAALSELPGGYRHAYDAAGSGWSYTWPVPCPVYAIDQCIVGARIQPIRYELVTTSASDHRMGWLELSVGTKTRGD